MARGEPEREVAAGRVAEDDDAVEVERVRLRDLAQVVGAAGHVLERARPPAARVADPAVLEAPRREILRGQGRGQGTHLVERPRHLPAAAVDHEDDGVGTAPLRQAQLGHLLGGRTVGDRVVGRRLGQGRQVPAGHEGPGGRRSGHQVTLPFSWNSGRGHSRLAMTARRAATASQASANRT